MRPIATLAAASLAMAAAAVPAWAHAFLDHAVPAVGSTVAVAPRNVRIFFTQNLEPAFSGIAIATAGGAPVPTAPAAVDPGNRAELVLPLPPLAPGRYVVSWHVVSVDTHRTEGRFSFTVGR